MNIEEEQLQIRVYGGPELPTLIYLPGLHGDWTLVSSFRAALGNRARFVEVIYPRSLTWSFENYTDEVERALLAQGIDHGWLLAESWGSQLAWKLLERCPSREGAGKAKPDVPLNAGITEDSGRQDPCPTLKGGPDTIMTERIRVEGVILAGGFVKHPLKRGPALLMWIGERTPARWYRLELKIYAWYANFRHRHAPEALATMKEFIARRTGLDRQAMRHRLKLLEHYDPRPTARQVRQPVHYLAGSVDPLVPWPIVRWWLRKNCPGYRGGRTFWLADHNVLATSPKRAADLVMKWMGGTEKREAPSAKPQRRFNAQAAN